VAYKPNWNLQRNWHGTSYGTVFCLEFGLMCLQSADTFAVEELLKQLPPSPACDELAFSPLSCLVLLIVTVYSIYIFTKSRSCSFELISVFYYIYLGFELNLF